MARKPKTTERTPLDEARDRIKEAERKLTAVVREYVGVDEEGYGNIATLIERGFGKKIDVLRQALTTGLRAMVKASDPDVTFSTEPLRNAATGEPFDIPGLTPEENARVAEIYASVTGKGAPVGPAITTPPSVQRRLSEGEDVDDAPAE